MVSLLLQGYYNYFRPMSDPRISEPQCGTITVAGLNFKSKEIWEGGGGGIIREAVLLEREALLERIR